MKKIIIFVLLIASKNSNAQNVTTLAGTTTSGSVNGVGIAAKFGHPQGIAADDSGNVYVADYGNNLIRKIVVSTGVVSTFAGSTTHGSANGIGAAASFYGPWGIAYDGIGNLYVADYGNNMIRKIVISTRAVTTLAGSTTGGLLNATGSAAKFYLPVGVACDGNGNVFVADLGNNMIRQIVASTGVVTTLAGSATSGSNDGIGTSAKFNYPNGVAYDDNGNLFVADANNYEIRKIVISTGVVTTIAGSTTQSSPMDGVGTSASFGNPNGISYDSNGNLYITDGISNEIRKLVISTLAVTTIAGSTTSGSNDGIGSLASFKDPFGLTFDSSGNLYIADTFNNEIRMITGLVTGINSFVINNIETVIYPNPTSDQFYIEANTTNKLTVDLYDVNGRNVFSANVKDKSNINVTTLDNGIYTLTIKSFDRMTNKKLVIAR